jgi:hypothetical protein
MLSANTFKEFMSDSDDDNFDLVEIYNFAELNLFFDARCCIYL